LTLHEAAGVLSGQLEYAADLFDAATVERIGGALRTLLAAAAAAPETPLRELPLLTAGERRQVVADWNRTAVDFPRAAAVHELFDAQSAATPGAVAVVHGEAVVTYGELARRSDGLARRLLALGVAPEERVALCAGRTPGLIAAMLGILKAGGAYLPLDPSHPAERLAWTVENAGARILVAERRVLSGLPPDFLLGGVQTVFLDDLGLEDLDVSLPAVPAGSLAYVMYTSGSTGEPKGVAVTHRNIVRLVRGAGYTAMGPEQTWLQLAPVSFDAATLEIWAPLLNGGRLVLFPGERVSMEGLEEAVARYGVTSLWLTAGLFHQVVDWRPAALRPLRQLLAGGDVVSAVHARLLLEALPGLTLIDGYGPTEGTTFTACHVMTDPRQVGETVPIGKPIANARVYVLDAGMRPVPPGVAGELYAAGDGLARGYLGRPDLTAERFLPDAFGEAPGERLYRTGDRVRWMGGADGVLEFLGRIGDGQVNIRGFLIETGEVEAALAAHPAVRQAAVLGRMASESSDRELVAYLVTSQSLPPGELQRFLRARLPEPMIPAAWVFAEALPLTANGKVDRRALAGLEGAVRVRADYLAPRTPLEEHLVHTCAEVLALDRESVGVRDNFFDLGGHSLLAMQFVARLQMEWDLEMPLQLLFNATDLADLAERLTEQELAAIDPGLLQEMMAELGEEAE
jgi:amino acid adenylation domain-containing protein